MEEEGDNNLENPVYRLHTLNSSDGTTIFHKEYNSSKLNDNKFLKNANYSQVSHIINGALLNSTLNSNFSITEIRAKENNQPSIFSNIFINTAATLSFAK